MSEQESVWYYTQHGEKKGPVTLDVLRGALEHLKIDRNRDLIWGPGLQDWVKVEEVPELQSMPSVPPPLESYKANALPRSEVEKRGKPKVVPNPAAETNPYKSPASIDEDDNALAEAMAARRGEGYRGMGRLAFFLWNLLLLLVAVICCYLLMGRVEVPLSETQSSTAIIAVLTGVLVYVVISVWITLSRLTNLSMSRWNYLWYFIPFANIWLSFRVVACPAGYGEHKQLDTAGKVMRVLLILYFIISIAMAILFSGASVYKQAADKAAKEMNEESQTH